MEYNAPSDMGDPTPSDRSLYFTNNGLSSGFGSMTHRTYDIGPLYHPMPVAPGIEIFQIIEQGGLIHKGNHIDQYG